MSKFIRTQMRDEEGNFVAARINTTTGEIKPYTYKYKPEGPDWPGKMDMEQTRPAHWELVDPPMYGDINKALSLVRKGSSKTKHNPNHSTLSDFYKLSLAEDVLSKDYGMDLENILAGVSHLHRGTRPLSQSMLFSMLRDLPEVNTSTVAEYTGHKPDYARKIAQCLRVLVNAFDAMLEKTG